MPATRGWTWAARAPTIPRACPVPKPHQATPPRRVGPPSATERVETSGHLVDSGLMSRIFDTIIRHGAEFKMLHFEMGRTNEDPSHAKIEITAPTPAELEHVLGILHELGCVRTATPVLQLEPAPAPGIAPKGFYSTTNHPTSLRLGNDWVDVEAQRMDAAIVVSPDRRHARCTKLRDLAAGDLVVCGMDGVRVTPPARERDRSDFAFMSNDVSSERRVRLVVSQLAKELGELKARGGRLVVVAGPVVVHTGGSEALCELVRRGYVAALLAGNALAVHDLENALYGTSLGISTSTGMPGRGGPSPPHPHHQHGERRRRDRSRGREGPRDRAGSWRRASNRGSPLSSPEASATTAPSSRP